MVQQNHRPDKDIHWWNIRTAGVWNAGKGKRIICLAFLNSEYCQAIGVNLKSEEVTPDDLLIFRGSIEPLYPVRGIPATALISERMIRETGASAILRLHDPGGKLGMFTDDTRDIEQIGFQLSPRMPSDAIQVGGYTLSYTSRSLPDEKWIITIPAKLSN